MSDLSAQGSPAQGPFGPPPTGPPLIGQPAPALPPLSPSTPPPSAAPSAAPGFGPPSAAPGFGPPTADPAHGYGTSVFDAPTTGTQFGASPPAPGVDGRRPWWGMGDILLGLPFILVVAIVGTFVGAVFVSVDELTSFFEGTSEELPIAFLATGLIGQQAAQGIWPLIVSKWKGRGSRIDWRLRFSVADLWIGPLAGFAMLIIAGLAGLAVTELVNLEDEASADNTAFLQDAEGTPWIYVFVFAVVVGAPVVEEIFFRGLCLRAIEKRFGLTVGVIGSTIIFTLPHFIGGGLKGTIVLFTVIGLVGAGLGVLVAKLDRLGPAIIAHMVFNTVGVLGALGVIEDPEQSLGALLRLF